jgi:hypothetical protein
MVVMSNTNTQVADTNASVRVVDVTNEADELEGYAVIENGALRPTIHATRSRAHTERDKLEVSSGHRAALAANLPVVGTITLTQRKDGSLIATVTRDSPGPDDVYSHDSLSELLLHVAASSGIAVSPRDCDKASTLRKIAKVL